ncbi:MAG: molybdate ABC transporter substrate-binding protein [Planctomycetaceae bacterium]|nr:molybdate ABC transporter substrate-binding protein [Planctomycetaceae bacterium]
MALGVLRPSAVWLSATCWIVALGCAPESVPHPPSVTEEGTGRNTPPGSSPPVVVLVAASTVDAAKELAIRVQKELGVTMEISPGPSNGLAQQILNGAPADVFLSASETWVDVLRREGRVSETRPLLSNQLVVVVPRGRGDAIRQPSDLLQAAVGTLALGGEKVPVGTLADQALKHLKLLDQLTAQGKIVRGHDARATLAYVEKGEADAGIVYRTDAMISDRVETAFVFDESTHEPNVYSAVLVKPLPGDGGPAAEPSSEARKVYKFLFSSDATELFRKFGFAAPRDDQQAAEPIAIEGH